MDKYRTSKIWKQNYCLLKPLQLETVLESDRILFKDALPFKSTMMSLEFENHAQLYKQIMVNQQQC